MPLDDLVSVIETLQQRIATHRQSLQQNEVRTRAALIDPLLTALGWDVSDPASVTPEYTVGEGRADYALNGSETIPAAMVEAKRLGHVLSDDERMQMLNYANARGVRYAAVTDGNAWELYEVFKQAPLEERRLMTVRLMNSPAHELGLQFLLLWRPNVASGQPVEAPEPLFEPVSPSASAALFNVPTVPPGAPSTEPGWVSLSSFHPTAGDPPPVRVRFDDGSLYDVKNWRALVVETISWLWSKHLLIPDKLPVPHGPHSKQYIVNIEPVHGTGTHFHHPISIAGTPLFFDANVGVAAADRSRTLLNHCNVSPDTVLLQVEQ